MYHFSEKSKKNLAECHGDLQTLFNYIIRYIDCTVTCGHRGQTEQDEAYANGFSKVKFPNSKHNKQPSLAADVVPYPVDYSDTERFRWFGAMVKAVADIMLRTGEITNKIEWGGDWEWKDYPHFQIKT